MASLSGFKRWITALAPAKQRQLTAGVDKIEAGHKLTREELRQLQKKASHLDKAHGERLAALSAIQASVEAAIADLKHEAVQQRATIAATAVALRERDAALREQIEALQGRVAALADEEQSSRVVVTQLTDAALTDRAWRGKLHEVERMLDRSAVAAHVLQAIDSARIERDPLPHIVIDQILPPPVYETALACLPPRSFFASRRNKTEVGLPMAFGPAASLTAWDFVFELTQATLIPALLRKFEPVLIEHLRSAFPEAAGDDPARVLANLGYLKESRIFLRGAGYSLKPHRDPKWGFLTSLIYLARPGDREEYGTWLYAVDGDTNADHDGVYCPEPSQCRAVKMVPFRANTALVFLNSAGAHGASVPADAEPGTERYLYSVRVGPDRKTRLALAGGVRETSAAADRR